MTVNLAQLKPGDTLPSLTMEIGKYMPIFYAGASGDFNPIHIDAEFGKQVGLGGNILQGLCTMAIAARMVGDAAGDPGVVKTIKVRFEEPVYPGDRITVHGKVIEKQADKLLCELWVENQNGKKVITQAGATLQVPSTAAAPSAKASEGGHPVTADQLNCKMILEAMPSRFNPEGAGSWNTVVQFNFSGDKGGSWYLTVKDGKCSVAEGAAEKPNATVNTTGDTWIGMITGKINPQMAFMSGQLKIQGNMGDIMKLNNPAVFRRT